MGNAEAIATQHSDRRVSIPFVSRVRIRNYKSLAKCDVQLGPLTVLVGRNGSGKSNFLDALRFIVDSLQTSLDHAMKSRGGIEAVRRRSTGHPRNFAVEVEMEWASWDRACYGFEVAARPRGGFVVKKEYLRFNKANGSLIAEYHLDNGNVQKASLDTMPPAIADRLYLVNVSGLPEFRPVYDGLTAMGFYNLNPDEMKEIQSPDAGELLRRDGSNISSVIARMESESPETKERIKQFLVSIVPGVSDVKRVTLGPKETLEFRQNVAGSIYPWQFHATSMSDGTLRALGALVAVTQLAGRRSPASLVGIEEPETALHPAAAGALMDALREATSHTQVVVTSHSPDLLDQLNLESDTLLVVQAIQGKTEVAPVDPASRKAIREHLYSPGEMLRMDQLAPDDQDLQRQRQLKLFDFGDGEDD